MVTVGIDFAKNVFAVHGVDTVFSNSSFGMRSSRFLNQ